MVRRSPRRAIGVIALSSMIVVSILLIVPYITPSPPEPPEGTSLDISQKPNMISNPGFESGDYGPQNIPSEWHKIESTAEYEWVNESSLVHSGSKCIRLGNAWNEEGSEGRARVYTTVTLESNANITNRRFLLHLWTRTDNVELGSVWVVVWYRTVPEILTYDLFRCSNSTDWVSSDFILETIPSETTIFQIELMLDNAPGSAWFDDVFLVELNSTEYETVSQLERFAPLNWSGSTPAGTPGASTHLEQIDGAWWLVDSTGSCFWSTGVSSDWVDPYVNPYLWTNLGITDQAGLDQYIGKVRVRLKEDLNFNTNYRDTVYGATRNHIAWMNFGTEISVNGTTPSWVLKDHAGITFGGNGAHQFPDPFDPTWQTLIYQLAYDGMTPWLLSLPDLIGYWTDNEMQYGPVYKYIYNDACMSVFIEWLQGNLTNLVEGAELPPNQVYTDINELNDAWSNSWHTYDYASWEELQSGADPVRIRGWNDTAVMDDMYAFEREIYRAYCHYVIDAIRTAEDAVATDHKLIISNRIAYSGPSYYTRCLKRVMDLFSDFDIIGLNLYPVYNRMRTHYVREYLEDLEDTIVSTTGRPFIVAEFGLGGRDSGVPVERWRPHTVDTQELRGIGYRNLVNQLFHLPYSLGMHWYKWSNEYYSSGYYDPRNCGIIDDYDDYYQDLASHIASTNENVNTYGRSGAVSIASFCWDSLSVTIIDGT